jgi:hypothetical protein
MVGGRLMSDEIMLVFGEDGVARKYDDTWDITIHCESEEEQKLVWEKLNNSNQEDCNKLAKDTNVPCKDTISRQAAIDEITEYGSGDTIYMSVVELKRRIERLPSTQPEQRWIPCGERLPEVGTYVLISKKALGFRSNLPNVCTAHRSHDPRSGKEEWNDMLFGKLDDDDVLAWMPLPEPYRAERRTDE